MNLRSSRLLRIALALAALTSPAGAQQEHGATAKPVIVASKPFGESYLLCELFAQLLESRGMAVDRRPGLGSTEIAFAALRNNAIDVYPEYTGTGLVAVLHDTLTDSLAAD
ncbi:MAG: glycine betaine ABC transporter substrate-binding protein, partial [bacterium]